MRNCLFFLIFILSAHLNAQVFSGIVEYTAEMNNIHREEFIYKLKNNEEIPTHIKSEVMQLYANAQPETYKLYFNEEESFFKHIQILNVDGGYNIGSKAGTSSYYSNKDKVIEYSILGYILKDPLKWTITSDTKTIGGFNCFKAKATEKLMSRKGYTYEKDIVVWFASELAVPFGPQNYSGLPGLVVEVIRDDYSIIATKIDLNPNEDVKIKRPKESRIISQKEANAFIKARAEEN
jgi:GLPGLI family protein